MFIPAAGRELPCSYQLQVVNDAPQTRLVLMQQLGASWSWSFRAKWGCMPAEFLLDLGAGVSFVSRHFAEKAGLSWDKASEDFQVSMPDGSLSPVIGQCKVRQNPGLSVLGHAACC